MLVIIITIFIVAGLGIPAVLSAESVLFSDNFNDNVLNTSLWSLDVVGTGNAYAETGGQAKFTTWGPNAVGYHCYILSIPFGLADWGAINISGKYRTDSNTHRVVIGTVTDADDTSSSVSVQYDTWFTLLRYFVDNSEYATQSRSKPTSLVDFSINITPEGYTYYEAGVQKYHVPTTTFSDTEQFTLRIGAWDMSSITSSCYFDDILVTGAPASLIANFSANVTEGAAPLAVNFTDLSTGDIISWYWEFGDGNSSSDQNPENVYSVPGYFTVNLTVMDSDEETDERSRIDYIHVTSGPTPLAANFTANVTEGAAPLAVNFTDLSTGDGIWYWSWEFGDGNTSGEQNPENVYSLPGLYTVNLTVMDEMEYSDTLSRTDYINVTAAPAPLKANFTANVTEGAAPLAVNFTDLSTGDIVIWYWEFGDGNSSYDQNPENVYFLPGLYTVNLTVANASEDSDILSRTDYINVTAAPAPLKANFTANVTEGAAPLAVNFTDLSTGEGIWYWSWEFGDGNTSYDQNPENVYSLPGMYTVNLTVMDEMEHSDTLSRSNYINVTAAPEPLKANFTANVTQGNAPLAVNFTDLSTGDIVGWSWEFGDGNTSGEQNPENVYSLPGMYTVNLTVMDPDEETDMLSRTDYINVTAAPPIPLAANFTANVTDGVAPLAVNFTDLSTGEIISWSWDFGDGNTSGEQNPENVYSLPGLYTVNLTVMDPDEHSDMLSRTDYINVTAAPPPTTSTPYYDGGGDLPPPPPAPPSSPEPTVTPIIPLGVHNINTGLDYATIQEAIDAPQTLNGHRIAVDPGFYAGGVVVNKRLVIGAVSKSADVTVVTCDASRLAKDPFGGDRFSPLLLYAPVFTVQADNVTIEGFTLTGSQNAGVKIDGARYAVVKSNTIRNVPAAVEVIGPTPPSTSPLPGLLSSLTPGILPDEKSRGDSFTPLTLVSGVLVKDNLIESCTDGISLSGATGGQIAGNEITGCSGTAIVISAGSDANTITGNTLMSSAIGIGISASTGNLASDNILSNTVNAVSDASVNQWNTTPLSGTNIIDGPYRGGNYWNDYTGVDLDADGLGDTLVPFGPGDYHPLLAEPVTNLQTGEKFRTLQAAIDDPQTHDGHTITAAPGVYPENLVIGKELKIIGIGGSGNCTIRGENTRDPVIDIQTQSIFIEGFTIDGISPIHERNGILLGGSHLGIADCVVRACAQAVGTQKQEKKEEKGLFETLFEIVTGDKISDITITNCTLTTSSAGIAVSQVSDVHILNCTITDNGAGIRLTECNTGNIAGSTFDGNTDHSILLLNSNSFSIRENTISGSIVGISLADASSNIMRENVVTDNQVGISAIGTNGNQIFDNYFANAVNAETLGTDEWTIPGDGPRTTRDEGVRNIVDGLGLGGNYWSDYTGHDGDHDGFGDEPYDIPYPSASRWPSGAVKTPEVADKLPLVTLPVENLDTGIRFPGINAAVDDPSTMDGHTITVDDGVYREHVVVDKGVTIQPSVPGSMPLIIAPGGSGTAVSILASNATVTGFEVAGASASGATGVEFSYAASSTLEQCRVRDNFVGVRLTGTSDCTIKTNFVTDNEIGIAAYDSDGNQIYDNYFSNAANTAGDSSSNIWFGGTIPTYSSFGPQVAGPSIVGSPFIGGNFWSDYTGTDSSGDGLGDTSVPYLPEGQVRQGSSGTQEWFLTQGDRHPLVLTHTGPIHINGNANFTPANGVVYGAGTVSDPYIIEGYTLSWDTGPLVWVEHTTAPFVIRNCRLNGIPGVGVMLDDVQNGKIEAVSNIPGIFPAGQPVVLTGSSHNEIVGCTFSPAHIFVGMHGITLTNSPDNLVSGNTISPPAQDGYYSTFVHALTLSGSPGCVIEDNTLAEYPGAGLWIDNSDAVSVQGNAVHDDSLGIVARFSDGVVIDGNEVSAIDTPGSSPVYFGSVQVSEWTTITYASDGGGIIVCDSSAGLVHNNTVTGNAEGVQLINAHDCTVSGNTISGNILTAGVIIEALSTDNSVENNTIVSNAVGVFFEDYGTTGNTVADNLIGTDGPLQGIGVRLGQFSGVAGNTLTGNLFSGNSIGVSTRGGQNLVYNNYFDSVVTEMYAGYDPVTYESLYTPTATNVRAETVGGHPRDDNLYNVTPVAGENIIGGSHIGGNYWNVYEGIDINDDGLADSPVPYNRDYHPLVNIETIHIRSDAEFDADHGVTGGSGTAASPYIIEGHDVSAHTGHAIWVEDTTAHFVVRDCTLHDGKSSLTYGLFLDNVTNGTAEGLTATGNTAGVVVRNSGAVTISGGTYSSNTVGIRVEESTGVAISGVTVTGSETGIRLVNTSWSSAGSSLVSTSSQDGLSLSGASNCTLQNIFVEDSVLAGIGLYGCRDVSVSDSTAQQNNYGAFNSGNPDRGGIFASSSQSVTVQNCTFSHNENNGAKFASCSGIVVNGSTVTGNYYGGWTSPSGISLTGCSGMYITGNQVLSHAGSGVYATMSAVEVRNNTISGNTAGIRLKGSGGLVRDNLVTGGVRGILAEQHMQDSSRSITVERNTITGASTAGIELSSSALSATFARNRILSCGKAIQLASLQASPVVSDSSFYQNSGTGIGVTDTTGGPLTCSGLYSGGLEPPSTDAGSMVVFASPAVNDDLATGSPVLNAAIVNISSAAGYTGRQVGGLTSFQLAAEASAGLSHRRLVLVETATGNETVLVDGPVTGYANSSAVVTDVLALNDTAYDVVYEVTDTAGREVSGFAQLEVRNANIRITSVDATKAERIYTFRKVGTSTTSIPGDEIFAEDERGSYVYVNMTNEGVAGGGVRLEVKLPGYLSEVGDNPVKYLWLEPGESLNATFYIPLTDYSFIDGWKPADPSVFPANKTLPITAEVRSAPGFMVMDTVSGEIPFKLGPIFSFGPIGTEQYIYAEPFVPETTLPYDGDGDGTVEVCEDHHYRLEFYNIGDEPATVEQFLFYEIIECDSTLYERNFPDRGYIADVSWYYPGLTFQNPQSYYAPEWWADSGTLLFGDLYPQGTTQVDGTSVSGQNALLRKFIRNGYKEEWNDFPAEGIYPPIDYAGDVITYIAPKYTVPGSGQTYWYFSPSINQIAVNMPSLEKSFVPAVRTLKSGDITVRTFGADPESGRVQLTLENSNEYVYFEYKADSHYDTSPEGYRWYHTVPPEYKFNVFVDDAKDPARTIPHLDVDFGVRWSVWANELKLGMIALEAVVNIILQEATGGAVEVEFGDAVMSITNTLLMVMNAAESIESGTQPIVVVNGVTFDQAKIATLASHGLDDAYFDSVRSGDVDAGMITTLINAIKDDPDLKEVFVREMLKVIAGNLGLTELYDRMNDPEAALAADFDSLKDELLAALVDDESLTSAQADQIGGVVDAASTFMDMGEWAYNNLVSTGAEQVSFSVVDPPGTLESSVTGSTAPYFGGVTGEAAATGSGEVTLVLREDGMVDLTGKYTVPTGAAGIDGSLIDEMTVGMTGVRGPDGMEGSTVMRIDPTAANALDAVVAFNNPALQQAMLGSCFERLDSVEASTEGGAVVLTGQGILRADGADQSVESVIVIRPDEVTATMSKTGSYANIDEGIASLAIGFGPLFSVPMDRTALTVVLPPGSKGFDSDLPFEQDGDVYRLGTLPESVAFEAEMPPPLWPWLFAAVVIILAAGAVWYWRKRI